MRRLLLGGLTACMSLPAFALEDQPSQPYVQATHVITKPHWKAKPNPPQLYNVFPRRALQRQIAGSASIHCLVTTRGKLKACSIASEDPPDAGFGKAELALARYFELEPMTVDGKPVEAEVTVPIRFDIK